MFSTSEKVQELFFCISLLLYCTLLASFTGQDDLASSMKKGEEIYQANCVTCHMQNGEGIPGAFPPLAKADYLLEDKDRAILQVLNGASGQMVVNEVTYFGEMMGFDFTDQEVADVLNYVMNSWGNEAEMIKPEEVAVHR